MERARQSDTWALAQADVRPWLLMLWAVAWEQTPCGSLPAEDELIAARIGMPMRQFAKLKPVLLRRWWCAEDGRLYHDVIVLRVLEMMETRSTDRTRQDARRNLFEKVRERDGRSCVYCGHTKYLTLDHLMPVSRGGNNDENNLATACRPCNSKKRDRTPEEAGMSFLSEEAADRWERYKKSGGEKRRKADAPGKTPGNATGTGTGTGTPVLPTEPTPPTKTPSARSRAAAAPLVCVSDLVSEGVEEQVAADWLLVRKAKTLPLTRTAWDGVKAQAERAKMSPAEAVKTAVLNGWGGFKSAWLDQPETKRLDRGAQPITVPPAETKEQYIARKEAEREAEKLTPEQIASNQAAKEAAMAKYRARVAGIPEAA